MIPYIFYKLPDQKEYHYVNGVILKNISGIHYIKELHIDNYLCKKQIKTLINYKI